MLNEKNKKGYARLVSILTIWMLIIVGVLGIFVIADNIIATSRTNVSGIISTNTTWTVTNSPYIVTGNILVDKNTSLTIQPGVTVKFDGFYYIWIDGILNATGSKEKSITFTSNEPNPTKGDWDKIKLGDTSNDTYCIIKYCEIKYSVIGIHCEYSAPTIIKNIITDNERGINCYPNNSPNIINNIISNNEEGVRILTGSPQTYFPQVFDNVITNNIYGIKINGPEGLAQIDSNIIGNNTYGIYCVSSHPNIIDNTIINNSQYGIFCLYTDSTPQISGNTITKNGDGVYIKSGATTITKNNLYDNLNYNIENFCDKTINATYNWWGTIDTNLINQSIYDFYDDFGLGKVNYLPILSSPVNTSNMPPVADAGPDNNTTKGQIVYFDGSDSFDYLGDPLKYNWDFDDGTSTGWQNSCNTSHSYNQTGNFNVTLSVTDGDLLDIDSCIIQVINQPPVANAGTNQNATVNQTVNFDGSGSYDPDSDPLTYDWDFGDNTSTGWQSNCNASHIYNTAGNYTVTLTVSDGLLTDFDTCIVMVTSGGSSPAPPNPYDPDGDSLFSDIEIEKGTFIDDADSDDDGILDGAEMDWDVDTDGDGKINARDPDSDGDGIYDGTEVGLTDADLHPDTNLEVGYFKIDEDNSTTTDPLNWDTDGDGKADGDEDKNRDGEYDEEEGETDPLFADTDEDGIENSLDPDDDNDGMPDWWEIQYGLNSLMANDANGDPDGDAYANLEEFLGDDGIDGAVDDSSDPLDPTSVPSFVRNSPPVAVASASKTMINTTEKISFYAYGSYDPDGDELTYRWKSGIDGLLGNGRILNGIILSEGIHNITLEVIDGRHKTCDYLEVIVYRADAKDMDNDDVPDYLDPNPNSNVDTDIDGLSDDYETVVTKTDPNNADTDRDGVNDSDDFYPLDAERWAKPGVNDSDGDTYPDDIDAFPLDPDEWLDTDGDGVGDNSDAFPNDPDRYLKEKVDERSDFESFTIIFIVLIIVIILILILTLIVFRKKSPPPEESDDLIAKLRSEALTLQKPSDFGLTEQEILNRIDQKYQRGEISDTTYNMIKVKLGGHNR